jgi:hypothetical protein
MALIVMILRIIQPQVSSYDYDAPLDEAGNATDKFMQFRAGYSKAYKLCFA